MGGKNARARRKQRRVANAASVANAGEAIPGLPNHLVVAHILRSEYFDDPADLARLPAVSSAMRDTIAATGLQFEEPDDPKEAVFRGCLSAVQRMYRTGRLPITKYLCFSAARRGHLDVLKWVRANGCRWNNDVCNLAVMYGHFEMLKCARANCAPWNEMTISDFCSEDRPEMHEWLRVNGSKY